MGRFLRRLKKRSSEGATAHCNHSQRLDLKALPERLGPDTPAMHDDLAPRLKCSKCGGRKIGLTTR
jgi:hypothetical protein